MRRWIISVPFGVETGGPEALHQLCHMLRELGEEAFVIAETGTEKNDRISAYEKYDAPQAISLRRKDLLIVPEVTPLRILETQKSFIWWLSIDNSPLVKNHKFNIHWKLNLRNPTFRNRFHSKKTVHLVQSEYARNYLKDEVNLETRMLSDWVEVPKHQNKPEARKYITVNGNKGLEKIKIFQELLPDIEIKLLKNMSKTEAMRTLSNSTLYIDLGHQPGKDRLPREAALLNVPVMLVLEGAAKNSKDFPISQEYKFEWGKIHSEVNFIRETFRDSSAAIKNQYDFKKTVENERTKFKSEVQELIDLIKNEH